MTGRISHTLLTRPLRPNLHSPPLPLMEAKDWLSFLTSPEAREVHLGQRPLPLRLWVRESDQARLYEKGSAALSPHHSLGPPPPLPCPPPPRLDMGINSPNNASPGCPGHPGPKPDGLKNELKATHVLRAVRELATRHSNNHVPPGASARNTPPPPSPVRWLLHTGSGTSALSVLQEQGRRRILYFFSLTA